jgi:hypothetical protein
MDAQGLGALSPAGINHEWQGSDVIHVRMREKHIVDEFHLVEGKVAHARPRINEDAFANKEGRGSAVARNRT